MGTGIRNRLIKKNIGCVILMAVMGKIFENHENAKPPVPTKLTESNEAYGIPSMFSDGGQESDVNDYDGL